MKIENTDWAKDFKKKCNSDYQLAMKYAKDRSIVFTIEKRTDLGKPLWAIINGEFWMDAKTNKKDAIKLCKDMGWQWVVVE